MSTSLAFSIYSAQCVEIGVFASSCASAVGVALIARQTGNRIGQSGMLSIYYLLASSLVLAIVSLTDFCNLSLLGEGKDALTGVVIGGVIACVSITVIAASLSKRFSGALSWGAVTAAVCVWIGNYICSEYIGSYYLPLLTMAGQFVGFWSLAVLYIYRRHLSYNQYISAIGFVLIFTAYNLQSAADIPAFSILHSLLIILLIMHFIIEYRKTSDVSCIVCAMLLLSGFSGISYKAIHTVIGINEIIAGIPSLLCSALIVVWLYLVKNRLARSLYWISTITFVFFGISCVLPKSIHDRLTSLVIIALVVFVLACLVAGLSNEGAPSWRKQLVNVSAIIGVVAVLALCSAMVSGVIWILNDNHGIVRLLPLVRNTPLWPGDKQFVRLVMRKESLWLNEVNNFPPEVVNLKQYLQEIRPSADRFSSIISTFEHNSLYQGFYSETLGFSWLTSKDKYILLKVDKMSAAAKLGLVRGDRVIAVNGVPVNRIQNDDSWRKLIGPWESGIKVSLAIRDKKGCKKDADIVIGESKLDMPESKVFTTPGGNKIGYLYVEGFSSAQLQGIEKQFSTFKNAGVSDLVLDLRYNGGGTLRHAAHLADLIAGNHLDGRLFIAIEHASVHKDRDNKYYFKRLPESLHIKRLAVLTTENTCSASEIIINGLQPYLPVYTIGSTTCGKPYIMEHIDFGNNTLLPVTARMINSRDEGHYDGGIRPDFKVEDDPNFSLGAPQEKMLKKALEILDSYQ